MTDIGDWSEWMDGAIWDLQKALRETPYEEDPAARAALYRAVDRIVVHRGTLRHFVTGELLREETDVAAEEDRLRGRRFMTGDLQARVTWQNESWG